jgi:hypothetical protein
VARVCGLEAVPPTPPAVPSLLVWCAVSARAPDETAIGCLRGGGSVTGAEQHSALLSLRTSPNGRAANRAELSSVAGVPDPGPLDGATADGAEAERRARGDGRGAERRTSGDPSAACSLDARLLLTSCALSASAPARGRRGGPAAPRFSCASRPSLRPSPCPSGFASPACPLAPARRASVN